jgi:hypothetical protein
MPEIVTSFQPFENPKKPLKIMAHCDIAPRFLPTKIREDPFYLTHRQRLPLRILPRRFRPCLRRYGNTFFVGFLGYPYLRAHWIFSRHSLGTEHPHPFRLRCSMSRRNKRSRWPFQPPKIKINRRPVRRGLDRVWSGFSILTSGDLSTNERMTRVGRIPFGAIRASQCLLGVRSGRMAAANESFVSRAPSVRFQPLEQRHHPPPPAPLAINIALCQAPNNVTKPEPCRITAR